MNGQKLSASSMVVQDMPHMANFVYSYYMERMKLMKQYYEVNIQHCQLTRFGIKTREFVGSEKVGGARKMRCQTARLLRIYTSR